MRCMSRSAPRWCRSRAMKCPCSIAAGVLKEHLHTRAAAGLFDVSHMGQIAAAREVRRRRRMLRWRWSGWCRRTSWRSPPGRQRYAQFTNEAGGILDDLMVANFGDHLFLVVNAACKDADEAHLRDESVGRLRDRAACRPRAAGAAGPEGRIGAGEIHVQARRRCGSWMPARARSPASTASSRARAIPARTALRFRCRPNRPSSWRRLLLDRRRRAADRAWRARQPAAGGRALPLRPRHRHHDHAGRGRAGMVGAEEPPRRRRAGRRLSRRGKDPRPIRQRRTRAAASACRPEGRAPVREGAPLFADATSREPIGTVTSGGFGPTPECAGRDGLSADRARRASARRSSPKSAASACRCKVAATPFVPNTYKR